ncbi:OB-fold domain-containing protein [Streptomyces sp. NPDC047000]|uniref:Zn-ribbon domain-containing OB-fold protein n=1 Tax=Streptomyces sp. NPDC047000 TaxID=3155474 RepID=UPI00340750E2
MNTGEEHVSTPTPSASSAAELSTAPFEDLVPRTGDVGRHGDTPHLVGSACRACGAKNFPRRMACLSCGGTDLGDAALASHGVLYSHTTVHVSGSRETPYHLAYIDLGDGVRVLAPVTDEAVAAGIDQPVVLTAGADGAWAFTTPATATTTEGALA